MMAFFLAQQVILDADKKDGYSFAKVPEILKPQVRKVLVESGVGFLAETK